MKKEDLPKDTLAIVDLHSREINKIANIRSFEISEKERALLVYHITPPEDDENNRRKSKSKDNEPAPLHMIDLSTCEQNTYDHVMKYTLSKNGNSLVIVMQDPDTENEDDSEDENENEQEEENSDKGDSQPKQHPLQTVIWVETSTGNSRPLVLEEGDFCRFLFDDSGKKLSVIGTDRKGKRLYYSHVAIPFAS